VYLLAGKKRRERERRQRQREMDREERREVRPTIIAPLLSFLPEAETDNDDDSLAPLFNSSYLTFPHKAQYNVPSLNTLVVI